MCFTVFEKGLSSFSIFSPQFFLSFLFCLEYCVVFLRQDSQHFYAGRYSHWIFKFSTSCRVIDIAQNFILFSSSSNIFRFLFWVIRCQWMFLNVSQISIFFSSISFNTFEFLQYRSIFFNWSFFFIIFSLFVYYKFSDFSSFKIFSYRFSWIFDFFFLNSSIFQYFIYFFNIESLFWWIFSSVSQTSNFFVNSFDIIYICKGFNISFN